MIHFGSQAKISQTAKSPEISNSPPQPRAQTHMLFSSNCDPGHNFADDSRVEWLGHTMNELASWVWFLSWLSTHHSIFSTLPTGNGPQGTWLQLGIIEHNYCNAPPLLKLCSGNTGTDHSQSQWNVISPSGVLSRIKEFASNPNSVAKIIVSRFSRKL